MKSIIWIASDGSELVPTTDVKELYLALLSLIDSEVLLPLALSTIEG
jgi:hypothetical protein